MNSDTQPLNRLNLAAFGLVIAALLFGSGFLAGRWLSPSVPRANSPEVAFARAMADHHDQAVEMAVIIRDRTQDPDLSIVALDLTLTQTNQIGQMHGWLATWGYPITADPDIAGHAHMAMTGMATQAEVNQLQTLPVAQAEILFCQLMIRHHQGGIVMAEEALKQTKRPEVVRLADSIIAAQASEIQALQAMLDKRQ